MNAIFTLSAIALALPLAPAVVLDCKAPPETRGASAAEKSSSEAKSSRNPLALEQKNEKPKPTAADIERRGGPVIDGERFTVRQIVDHQQGGIPVGVLIAPEKWRDQSQVVWNYAHSSSPVKVAASAENPANEEATMML